MLFDGGLINDGHFHFETLILQLRSCTLLTHRHLLSTNDSSGSLPSSQEAELEKAEADLLANKLEANVKLNAKQVQEEFKGAVFPYFSRDDEGKP